MNLKKLVLYALSLTLLAPEGIKAGYDDENGTLKNKIECATLGFLVGYTTGLVPVIGQYALFFALALGPSESDALSLVGPSAIVGHTAGIATLGCAIFALIK